MLRATISSRIYYAKACIHSQSAGFGTTVKGRGMKQDKYRRKIIRRVIRPIEKKPTKTWKLPEIMTPTSLVPKTTKPLPDVKKIVKSKASSKQKAGKAWHDILAWMKENSGVIVLNFGSLCTLTAFTRSDILELRCLSMTGSISSVLYFLSLPPPKVWFPPLWSSVFASVNAYKVYFILEERKGKPQFLTQEELSVYEEHFKPHGVTPRMFEKLIHIATVVKIDKGKVLIENGEDLHSVYLVKSGAIDGVTGSLKRRVTAASTDKDGHKQSGSNSGAWIGELAFLDVLSQRDAKKMIPKSEQHAKTALSDKGENETASQTSEPHPETDRVAQAKQKAILTYIATEDSVVYQFDHKELRDLLKSSADLRAGITRAMTSAVVSKVINLYFSKMDADRPLWQKWLEDNWRTGVKDVDKDSDIHLGDMSSLKIVNITEVKKQE